MALVRFLAGLALCIAATTACDGPTSRQLHERALPGLPWNYDRSQDWGSLDPRYELCQTGTRQSPIALDYQQGLSAKHIPDFNYLPVSGTYYNWNYGPAFELDGETCTTGSTATNCTVRQTLPSFTFEENGVNETVYLVSWHVSRVRILHASESCTNKLSTDVSIAAQRPDLSPPQQFSNRDITNLNSHSPADHSVQNDRSKAELHLVHVDSAGHERAVLAIRIDPGISSYSNFIAQLPFNSSTNNPQPSPNPSIRNTTAVTFPNFNQTDGRIPGRSDPRIALSEAGNFREMWTYRGSLTSPPCTEGIRFFVARNVMFVSNEQMQDVLRVSTYSARQEQEVWMHEVNA